VEPMTAMVSTTVFFAVSITSTVSDWSSTTYSSDWPAFRVILFGWPFTRILAVTDGVPRGLNSSGAPLSFTTTISRSRRLDTYAVAFAPFPFTDTQNGYSPPGTPDCDGSFLPGRKSSSLHSDHLPNPPVNTLIESS
jgi:hypothetical protein